MFAQDLLIEILPPRHQGTKSDWIGEVIFVSQCLRSIISGLHGMFLFPEDDSHAEIVIQDMVHGLLSV